MDRLELAEPERLERDAERAAAWAIAAVAPGGAVRSAWERAASRGEPAIVELPGLEAGVAVAVIGAAHAAAIDADGAGPRLSIVVRESCPATMEAAEAAGRRAVAAVPAAAPAWDAMWPQLARQWPVPVRGIVMLPRPSRSATAWCVLGEAGGDLAVPRPAVPDRRAVVVGAGLAGSAVAEELAVRGWAVTVVERGSVAGGTSAIPRAIVEPVFAPADSPLRRLRWTGWSVLAGERPRWDARAGAATEAGDGCGVLLADGPRWRKIAERLGPGHPILARLDETAAAARGGVGGVPSGFFVPGAGWLSPPQLVRARIAEAERWGAARVRADVVGIEMDGDGSVSAIGSDGEVVATAGVLVDATAQGIEPVVRKRVEAARGAVVEVDAPAATSGLACVIGGRAACLPAIGDPATHLLASTFDHHDEDPEPRPDDAERIRRDLRSIAPAFAASIDAAPVRSRWGGVRRTTRDRAPMIGPFKSGGRVFASLAHGSRGIVGSGLAAAILGAWVDGEPIPALEADLAAVDPSRPVLDRGPSRT